MECKISCSPDVYGLSLFDGLKVSVQVKNDEETVLDINGFQDLVPKGFELIKVDSSSKVRVNENIIKIDEVLEPGESQKLISLFLIALRPGKVSYAPQIMFKGGKEVIVRREFSIGRIVPSESSVIEVTTKDEISVIPGESTSVNFEFESHMSETIDYFLLLDAFPSRLVDVVEQEEGVFQLDKGHLLFLKKLSPDQKKSITVQFKAKPYDELNSLISGKVEEKLVPNVVGKIGDKTIKTKSSRSYVFTVDATPKLAPPSVKLTPISEESILYELEEKNDKKIYLQNDERFQVSLILEKGRRVPISGVRITRILPKGFEIVKGPEDDNITISPSLIQCPQIKEKRVSIDFIVESPEKTGEYRIRPEIYCNERTKKVMVKNPLTCTIFSPEELKKTHISCTSLEFDPKSPFTPNTKVKVNLNLRKEGKLPIQNLEIDWDLPQLELDNLGNNPLLRVRENRLYKDKILPQRDFKAEILFECPKEAEKGEWEGECVVSWEKMGKRSELTVPVKYTIKPRGKLEKLKFW